MNRPLTHTAAWLALLALSAACRVEPGTDTAVEQGARAGAEVLAKTTEEPAADQHDQVAIVYKTPTCGCCSAWVDYMRDEGFTVETRDLDDLEAVKAEHGLSNPSLKSCHTALIDGYIIEGHVPADDVRRLLAERPEGALGLTAPGMPLKSPGMASRTPKDYDVLLFDAAGDSTVFSSY